MVNQLTMEIRQKDTTINFLKSEMQSLTQSIQNLSPINHKSAINTPPEITEVKTKTLASEKTKESKPWTKVASKKKSAAMLPQSTPMQPSSHQSNTNPIYKTTNLNKSPMGKVSPKTTRWTSKQQSCLPKPLWYYLPKNRSQWNIRLQRTTSPTSQ